MIFLAANILSLFFQKTSLQTMSVMNRTFEVPCPNCGGSATRSYFTSQDAKYSNCPQNHVIQVECSDCDYLMVMCSVSGSVVEAYNSCTSMFTSKEKGMTKLPLSA